MSFAQACRDTRLSLDVSQQQLADAIGVSRGYVANVESGRANPTLAQAERIAAALGLHVGLELRPPVIAAPHHPAGDLVHARCSGYVDRRLRRAGWLTAREVEVVDGRTRGWIDLLAFDPRSGQLLVIELKTRLDDLGAIERRLGWYLRVAPGAAIARGWRPSHVAGWLITLASDEVDASVRVHRDLVDRSFPVRATTMSAVIRGEMTQVEQGLAMVDPSSRRADWLIRTRNDGRRSPGRYASYADAAHRLGPRSSSRRRGE